MSDDLPLLDARLDAFEARLRRLEGIVRLLVEAETRAEGRAARRPMEWREPVDPPPVWRPRPRVAAEPSTPAPTVRHGDPVTARLHRAFAARSSAYWLSRAGVGLLLFGVAFLFRYAVDQGWLTPHIRVVLGLAVGLALVAVGLRVRDARRWFSGIALGGASATFYITGYAAFQTFHLVSYGPALAFLIAVTGYTLWVGWVTDEAALGVLGAIGGLATPFMLESGAGSIAGLAGYEAAVLAAGAGIYLRKGWRSLLWTMVGGGWAALWFAVWLLHWQYFPIAEPPPIQLTERWMLQFAIVIAVLAFWAVPVLRERLAKSDPARWPTPPFTPLERALHRPEGSLVDRGPQILVLSTPLIAFVLMTGVWEWSSQDTRAALVAFSGAVVWGTTWWHLRNRASGDVLTSIHAVAAAVLVAIGLQYLFVAHTLLLTWAVESAALVWLACRSGDRLVRVSAHGLGAVVGVWLAVRLLLLDAVTSGYAAYSDAVVIGLAAVGAYGLEGRERRFYRVAILTAIALWLRRELPALPGGDALALLGWAVLASVAAWLGRRWNEGAVETFAHVVFATAAAWLGLQLLQGGVPAVAVVNLPAVLRLMAIGTAVATARGLAQRDQATVYAGVAYALFLGWLWHELRLLPAGPAWVTVSWGLTGMMLLVAGLRRDHPGLRSAALATFACVVIKLFLVDLKQLEPIWRIVLFLGFGGVFMTVSYYFPSLWRMKRAAEVEA